MVGLGEAAAIRAAFEQHGKFAAAWLGARDQDPLPASIGPVEFAEFGRIVAVRCPRELAYVMQRAGGVWEPGSRRWPIGVALGR